MNGEYSEATKNLFPKSISSRHRAVMRLEIAGHTNNDIANDLGFNVQRLSVIMNSPLYKAERDKMASDIKRVFVDAEGKKLSTDPTAILLDGGTERAAKTLIGALDDVAGNVRVNAAKDILDRGGYVKEEKVRANVIVEASDSLVEMLSRIKDSKKEGDEAVKPAE